MVYLASMDTRPMNNNLIPSLLIDSALCYVGFNLNRRTDIDGNGAVELGDLLAVLSQWGQEASCPDVVQLQCGLMQLR